MNEMYEGLNNIIFQTMCKSSEDYYYLINMVTGESRWSKSAVDDLDLPGEFTADVLELWRSFVYQEDLKRFDAEMKKLMDNVTDYHVLEYRVRKRNGEYIKIHCRGNVLRNEEGNLLWFSGVISRLKEHLDSNTQLANIYEANKEIKETLANSSAQGGIMYLGIDDFKQINDMYTFGGGNEVLKQLAIRLKAITPPNVTLYRLDGDKFAYLFPYASPADMRNLYYRAGEEAKNIMLHEEVDVPMTLSAGICFYPDDGETSEILQRNAEYALERAKQLGKNQLTFFSRELLDQYLIKLRMIEAIKKSVKENFNGFELYYQPIVNPATGRIIECEALLRWKSDEFKNAGPADFIPILEDTGLIREVGEWVVETAVSQLKEWGDKELVVNVNVSYKQLKNGEFADYVLNIIDNHAFNPTRLVVELTESCKAHDMPVLVSTLDRLREQNVSVALDDFGTGYASLGVLREVPTDWIKIDHKFVAQCKNNWVDRNIVRHIILLAHALDIKVCVEGIENIENYQVASEENADTLQGYYFSKPVSAGEFKKLLDHGISAVRE